MPFCIITKTNRIRGGDSNRWFPSILAILMKDGLKCIYFVNNLDLLYSYSYIMNTIKDSWDDEDEDDSQQVIRTQTEQMKLENRKKEEEADHELTEDLFVMSKQTKPDVAIKTQPQHLPPKPKLRELVSKKDENERNIQSKVAVKKQVAASKQKHATVFGQAELDELQDEYCDYEDRY